MIIDSIKLKSIDESRAHHWVGGLSQSIFSTSQMAWLAFDGRLIAFDV
jgi:hypothetical protein